MNNLAALRKFLSNNSIGIISSKEILENNISRNTMNKLVDIGELAKYRRGLYLINNVFEDDFYILANRYLKGIFSHVSVLFLLDYI